MATQYENASISQIRSVFQTVNPISPQQYDVGLPLPLGTLFIRLKYPSDFPNSPPGLLVASKVSHPMIDNNRAIIYPESSRWSAKITVLSVLQNIHRVFSANPPQPIAEPKPVLPNFEEQLRRWKKPIEDESDILDFVYSIDDIDKLITQRDKVLESNVAKVNENLKKKEEYDQLVNEHQDEINELEALTSELGNLMKEVETVQKRYSEDKVIEKLKEMEGMCTKEAAEIQRKFMKKEIGLEEFIEEYQVPMKRVKFIQITREAR